MRIEHQPRRIAIPTRTPDKTEMSSPRATRIRHANTQGQLWLAQVCGTRMLILRR
jgi:hypothetical protein